MNLFLLIIIFIFSIPLIYILIYYIEGGIYGLIARRIIKSYNIFRNIYKKGKEVDILVCLELSIVFSQILYFKRREINIDSIREIAMNCNNNNETEKIVLKEFVKMIMIIILTIDTKNSIPRIIEKVNKKDILIEKIIFRNFGLLTGNERLVKRTRSFIIKNPYCWEGVYNDI